MPASVPTHFFCTFPVDVFGSSLTMSMFIRTANWVVHIQFHSAFSSSPLPLHSPCSSLPCSALELFHVRFLPRLQHNKSMANFALLFVTSCDHAVLQYVLVVRHFILTSNELIFSPPLIMISFALSAIKTLSRLPHLDNVLPDLLYAANHLLSFRRWLYILKVLLHDQSTPHDNFTYFGSISGNVDHLSTSVISTSAITLPLFALVAPFDHPHLVHDQETMTLPRHQS